MKKGLIIKKFVRFPFNINSYDSYAYDIFLLITVHMQIIEFNFLSEG